MKYILAFLLAVLCFINVYTHIEQIKMYQEVRGFNAAIVTQYTKLTDVAGKPTLAFALAYMHMQLDEITKLIEQGRLLVPPETPEPPHARR